MVYVLPEMANLDLFTSMQIEIEHHFEVIFLNDKTSWVYFIHATIEVLSLDVGNKKVQTYGLKLNKLQSFFAALKIRHDNSPTQFTI